jgi:hypothetical protein
MILGCGGRDAGDRSEIGPADYREVGGVGGNGQVGEQVRQVNQSWRENLPAREERLEFRARETTRNADLRLTLSCLLGPRSESPPPISSPPHPAR